MKILKFGGTSVGSSRGLSCIQEIVASQSGSVVVVVSALGGVTDLLLRVARQAAAGNCQEYVAELEALKIRHRQSVGESVAPENRDRVWKVIEPLMSELGAVLGGIALLGELSPRSEALVVSFGERMSSVIVSGMLKGSVHVDSMELFKTSPYFARHIIDFPATNNLIRSKIDLANRVTVMGGFISKDLVSGQITNLGRGGSDYTAAILAAALDARLLEIFTDVDGFMTADPRIVKGARLISSLGFVQCMELCNFGAKVLYPPTIFPAYNHNIPIVIKNTFNHCSKGTFIEQQLGADCDSISGVSSIAAASLITIIGGQGQPRAGRARGSRWLIYRLFKTLSRAGVSPFFHSISNDGDIAIGVSSGEQVEKALELLRSEFSQELALGYVQAIEVRNEVSLVAFVGGTSAPCADNRMGVSRGERILGELTEQGVEPVAINPTNQTNLAIIVERRQLEQVIRLIHALFFEFTHRHRRVVVADSDNSIIEYIEERNQQLVANRNIRLMTSRYNPREVELERGAIFVDCNPCNPKVVEQYPEILRQGVSILTFNSAAWEMVVGDGVCVPGSAVGSGAGSGVVAISGYDIGDVASSGAISGYDIAAVAGSGVGAISGYDIAAVAGSDISTIADSVNSSVPCPVPCPEGGSEAAPGLNGVYSIGVDAKWLDALSQFTLLGDTIASFTAIIPTEDTNMARCQGQLLLQKAGVKGVAVTLVSSQKEYCKTVEIRYSSCQNTCTIQPIDQGDQDLYSLAIRSRRFNRYPLHLWAKKLTADTIYSAILEFLGN